MFVTPRQAQSACPMMSNATEDAAPALNHQARNNKSGYLAGFDIQLPLKCPDCLRG